MDIRIAQLQKNKRLVRFEERLVEVEVGHLILMLEQGGDDVVDGLQSHLGHARLVVAGGLEQVGSDNGPGEHDVEEGTTSLDTPEESFTKG